jgi:hypothetical protein
LRVESVGLRVKGLRARNYLGEGGVVVAVAIVGVVLVWGLGFGV